jgi:hypothetical protein
MRTLPQDPSAADRPIPVPAVMCIHLQYARYKKKATRILKAGLDDGKEEEKFFQIYCGSTIE